MNQDWLILIKLSGCFLALFVFGEVIFHFFNAKAEFTRKLVHIGTGILTLTFPLLLQHLWQVIIICLSFLVLLGISIRYNFLKSINAIARPSSGSILFPLIVIVTFAYFQYQQQNATLFGKLLYFYLPILLMAVCDPIAALSGGLYKKYRKGNSGKTWVGSLMFFISACILSFTLCKTYGMGVDGSSLMWYILGVSFLTTVTERYGNGGWDNFTIPLTAIIFMTTVECIQ